MKRVLVLGGTGWLGREVARTWANRGAEVVGLARGQSGEVPPGVTLVPADRREAGAYDAVGGEWDEVIELSHEPQFVVPALDALAAGAGHWTLVSTVSVYARNDEPGADESAALVTPVDLSEYPDAKVAAERETSERLGDRLLIARAGLIVGPGDPSDRFGYWVARLCSGGTVLAPEEGDRYVQVIDVADLAQWLVDAGDSGLTGTVNAVGPSHTLADFFSQARSVTAFDGTFVHVPDAQLRAHDVRFWAGPRSLPLWLPIEDVGFAQRSSLAFTRAGGTTRPLDETLRRTLDDERERGIDRLRRSGLSRAEETQVIAQLAHDQPV